MGTGLTVVAASTPWSTVMYGWLNETLARRTLVIVISATAMSHRFLPAEKRAEGALDELDVRQVETLRHSEGEVDIERFI